MPFLMNEEYAIEYIDAASLNKRTSGSQEPAEDEQIIEGPSDLEELPSKALIGVWNGLAGTPGFDDMKPVKKFENRMKAAARIWEKIQKLVPTPRVKNLRLVTSKEAREAHKAELKARAAAKAKPETKPVADATEAEVDAETPRETAKDKVVEMLRAGTTLDAIMTATGWQRHTVRGFISGTVGKRMGLAVTAHTDPETKVRHYKITEARA